MDKRYPQKLTRDIPTSKTSRPKGFDAQLSSRQTKDVEPSRLQNKPEAARASTLNPKDLKQTRDIPTSKTSRPKNFHAQLSSLQAKDAGPSRPQSKPEAARANMSNLNDLKSKSGKHSASRHHDAILQVNQIVWKKQQHSDHGTSNSRQRQNSSAQLDWRQATLRHSSNMPSLGRRPFNPSLRRKLAGGGEETSEQQTHNPSTEERVYSHERDGREAWTQSRQQDSQDRSAKPEPYTVEDALCSAWVSTLEEIGYIRDSN